MIKFFKANMFENNNPNIKIEKQELVPMHVNGMSPHIKGAF